MQNQFYNQPVVNWAKQNLAQPVEIKVHFSSRIGRITIYALLLSIPLLITGCLIFLKLIGSATQGATWGGILLCSGVLLFPCLIIILVGIFTQQKLVKSLDITGVKSSKGRKFLWENLHYIDHVSKHTRAGGVSRIIKDNQLELVFADGKAIIPPLIQEREEIWSLINSIPAQVRDDGNVRAN
ncbi:MAG: hypothetical protein K1X72_19870 [Pyrinomonadaceae bacterium]|nr:hypothetical protein [Pyrinomonadaceae bacterium]